VGSRGWRRSLKCSGAAPGKLTIAGFFFRNLGDEHQKSHAGLSRALLYCIIDANRDLIPLILPDMWRDAYNGGKDDLKSPSMTETNNAFQSFAPISSERRFFFLVDGLDEYAGNHTDTIRFLGTLTSYPNVKALVSSRPITPCFAAFSTGPTLKLDDLNRNDITTYVDKTINIDGHMRTLLETYPDQANAILKNIWSRSLREYSYGLY
jgi:hypothetical protein